MNFLNHQSTGAKGLRMVASAFIVLGWIAFIVLFIIGVKNDNRDGLLLFIAGIVAVPLFYLNACILRAIASVAEAAQLYFDKNSDTQE